MQRWIAKDPETNFDVEYRHMVTKAQITEMEKVIPREMTPGYRPEVSWKTLNDGRLVLVTTRVRTDAPVVAGDGLDSKNNDSLLTIVGVEGVKGVSKQNFDRADVIARIRSKRESKSKTNKESPNGSVSAQSAPAHPTV